MRGFSEFVTEAKGGLKAMGAPKAFPPQTICGLMSGTEDKFTDWWAWHSGDSLLYPKGEEGKFYKALVSWFEMEGGNKSAVIATLMKAVKCPGRKPWTYYGGGKVYRGIPREIGRTGVTFPAPKIVTLPYYGEKMKFITGVSKYQSKYAMQSWSPSAKSAFNFATSIDRKRGKKIMGGWVPLVFELEVSKEETFLRPDLTKDMLLLNPYIDEAQQDELEVIRTVNPVVDAKVYMGHDTVVTQTALAIRNDKSYKSMKNMDALMEKHLSMWFGGESARKLAPLIRKPVQGLMQAFAKGTAAWR